MDQESVHADIAIIGGGIAGLWLLNRLCKEGYNAVLFEERALGSFQTVASQGMIHGGIKYTLGGALSGASEAIADMPEHWRRCLQGEGDVDLSSAQTLSDHFYMFSSASATSKMTTFLASKATRGRVEKVKAKDRPGLFQNDRFNGSLYKLVDMVLDVPSVVQALANNCRGRLFQVDWSTDRLNKNSDGTVSLQFGNGTQLHCKRVILSAGQGNEALLQTLKVDSPRMQRRPLQQVMVKHNYPHRFYGHCLGAEKTPRLTISSHPCADGSQVWYLGGSLAERSVGKPADKVIDDAKRELADLLPWVDLGEDARWATLNIDRAEPLQRNFARPDKAYVAAAKGCDNVLVAWPTKLTLSPNLATETLALLAESGVTPTSGAEIPALDFLPVPPVSETPWEHAFD
ncbi:FAD-dependent oxidoreductase [Porticoccaceae bacterium LTM1]|nr:FAD-dependent oxidoreductase [Porticoccaceae bacterium LTM1]